MLYIQELLKNIVAAHENLAARFSPKVKFGIITLLAIMVFIILIFKAEWLLAHMIALLPVFYIAAVLAVGLKRALYGTAVFVFFSFALWLRVGPPHQGVLGGSYVMFGENDGWYNMRLIENLVHHFPVRNSFEPYSLYPYGQIVPFAPFFDWSAALVIWVAGLGHPSTALIEKIGAYYPAILGALTIIPVYFIGKELFNRNAGLLAAGLLSILPGEFLTRSILGFTDHHIAEVLFSTITMLFFIMAVKRAQAAEISLRQIRQREWGAIKRPLLFAVLAGFWLGIYILSWVGAAIFIFVILVYLLVQYVLDHMNGKSTDYLFIVTIPVLLIALLMSVAFYKFLFYNDTTFGGLVIGLLGVIWLQILPSMPQIMRRISRYIMKRKNAERISSMGISFVNDIMARRNLSRLIYPTAVVISGFIGAGLLYLIDPSLFDVLIDKFQSIAPSSRQLTIGEAQPLLAGLEISQLTDHRIWFYFTTGFIMVPVAFLLISYSAIGKGKIGKWAFLGWIGILLLTVTIDQKATVAWQVYLAEGVALMAMYFYLEKSPARTILLIWCFVILMLLLSQTRYAYYYAIPVALLSSYILWNIPKWLSSAFQLTSKRWTWLAVWIAPMIITLIIDKSTYVSVPSIIYIVEGISVIIWIAYKTFSSVPKTPTVAEKRLIRAAKKRGGYIKEQKRFSYFNPGYAVGTLSVIIIFSLTIYPNLIYGVYNKSECSPQNSPALFAPSHISSFIGQCNTEWYEALTWMNQSTPDPFGNPDFYYDLYQSPQDGGGYNYPNTSYGVMSWWDYGHWITRVGRRLPVANPFQGGIGGPGPNGSIIPGASIFMTAQNESEASAVMDELDSRYVVIDYETAWPKYHTMVIWSGKNVADFYDQLWYLPSPTSNTVYGLPVCYPAYYQSMCARLYNFGTEAVTPSNSTYVVSYQWVTNTEGSEFKLITPGTGSGNGFDADGRPIPFPTYEQAVAFNNSHPGYMIVGLCDWIPEINSYFPVRSPIPLEALKEYIKIHSSPGYMPWGDNSTCYVEIYEYTGYEK